MKKITRIIALIIVCLVGSCAASEGMSLFRKSTGEFRFEDYETGAEAQEVLLKLHPVGSKVADVMQTLEKAGARCGFVEDKTNKPVDNIRSEDDRVYCSYEHSEYIIFPKDWRIRIYAQKNNLDSIAEIGVWHFYAAL